MATQGDISIIDALPLPSTLDLPEHGQLPSLPATPGDTAILNPLPPPLLFDNYEMQYGPISPTEPQLDPAPNLADGELPKFDGENDRYDFLRRTLSHSKRRYSARYKKPRPIPTSSEDGGQSSLDVPGQRRDHSPHRVQSPSRDKSSAHPLNKHHTVRGMHAHGDYQHQKVAQKRGHDRRSSPGTVRNTRVDNLGRSYVLDHGTHTIQYEDDSTDVTPDQRGRREMLNRRYESLHRSFRSAHHQRRKVQTLNDSQLTPSTGAISYLPGDSAGNGGRSSEPTAPLARTKKEQKSEKRSRWFGLGRRSNRSVSQSSVTSDPHDNIIPIVSPDILSPITPPPSLDDLGISLPPPLPDPIPNGGRRDSDPMVIGSMELERENGNESEQNGNQDRVAAILSAINTTSTGGTLPRPQSPVNSEEGEVPFSPTHRATDLDRVKAVKAQKQLSLARKNRQSQQEMGGDTDEETDITIHRTSVVSVNAQSDRSSVSPERGMASEEEQGEGLKRSVGSKKKTSKGLMESPALKFIIRPDLYTFLSQSGEAGEVFFSSKALVELVQRIRGQTNLFEKYQHSRQLVKALNGFADTTQEMPDGWEKKLNQQGRVFFIDHASHITTFIDPRLPLDKDNSDKKTTAPLQVPQSVRRVYSVSDEPVVRAHHSTVVQTMSLPNDMPTETVENIQRDEHASYEMHIVAFLRQPNVADKINQRYRRGVKPGLQEAIDDIRQNGVPGLERIQLAGGTAAYELGLILSLFDDEVNAINTNAPQITVNAPTTPEHETTPDRDATLQRQKQAFSAKLQTFKLQMARLGFAQSSRLKFNLRRDHLLEDSYEHIMKSEIRHLQRKRLNIAFKGEEGLDYGGPSREFFFLISREIFNPYFGLFEYSANDTYTVQISPTSCFIRNNLDWFRFAGRIIGLTIAQGFLLDVFFTRPFYKMLLKRPPHLKDLESLEPAFYSSLLWIMENDPDPLDLTFTIEEEAFGQLTAHELKEGGTDIQVVEENKKEYVDLMVKWRLDRGSQEQGVALMKGFNEIMPVSLIQQFDAQELEFITAGTLEIDIDDWRTNTDYRNGYHANHPVVMWFWKAVEMFDNEQRLRLLQFITGTSSVPYEGFKALRGSSGPKKFTIDYFNDVRSLPRSHTCFNRLDLPPYPSFQILYEKVRVAIEEGGTFGVE